MLTYYVCCITAVIIYVYASLDTVILPFIIVCVSRCVYVMFCLGIYINHSYQERCLYRVRVYTPVHQERTPHTAFATGGVSFPSTSCISDYVITKRIIPRKLHVHGST